MSFIGRRLLPSGARVALSASPRKLFFGSRPVVAFQTQGIYTRSQVCSSSGENHNTKDGEKGEQNKYTDDHRKKMANYYSMLIASLVGMIGSSYLLYNKFNKVDAKEKVADGVDGSNEEDSDTLHKSQAGFRERKIIEYENRIRAYSTPDKIFRYFATIQDKETADIYMTPEDFVRALTPDTMQPEGLGLDQFKKLDIKTIDTYESQNFGKSSVFYAFGEGGLISFSDYVFLLTVLGTSARHIDIAFKMFDLNGDGEVTTEEFDKVRSLFLSMTTTGSQHRDRKTTGNVLSNEVPTGLVKHFFGEDGESKLTTDMFVEFKRKLQQEVMFLEFSSYNPSNGRITESQFAEILLTYASFGAGKHSKILKRIKKAYGDPEHSLGISFQDYLDFFSFLLNIRDVEMALSFHTVAGQAIGKETFQQVATTVAGVDLSDYLVDIVFCIFDENEDNQLSNREFIAVMKDKMFRGLNKPRDTGFMRFLSAIVTCAKSNIIESWSQPDHKY